MPAVVTFDGPTRTITEIAGGIDNTLDVQEIYSEWKEWVRLSDNAKYLPAFRTIGGDPVSPTQNAGITYFLLNGWLIVPADLDHQLTLVGNIVPDGGVGNIFAAVPGRTVSTSVNFSNLIDTVATGGGSGLTQQQVRDAMSLPTNATPQAGSIDTKIDNANAINSVNGL